MGIKRSKFEIKLLNKADRSLQWTKKIKIWRGQGATLYDIGDIIVNNMRDLRLNERAAAISFNFLLAIPPTLIFLFSLVPFLPLDSVQHTILDSIKLLSPNEKLYSAVQKTILDLMNTKRKELISFGILATIFVSSNGVMGLLRSFDRKSPFHKERSSLARRGKSILLTLILMFVLIISIGLLVVQSRILNEYLLRFVAYPWLIQVFSWISLVLIIFVAICIIYKFGPSLNAKFRFFSPGAATATILFFAVSYGFFFVANHFVHYNKVYGSIGTLLMLMAWMFIIGLVILIGFEINFAIEWHNQNSGQPSKQKNNIPE